MSDVVTLSPKYQVVIPRAIRESLDLKAGQKIRVLLYEGRIELIPLRPLQSMRGFVRGIDTAAPWDEDRV